MNAEKIAYAGWPNCYRLRENSIELVITTDVGPRVIRCGFVDGPNLFKEFTDQLGSSGESGWQPRGGHRLWVAPESAASYALDNSPVEAQLTPAGIVLTQPVERETGFQKRLAIEFHTSGAIDVLHQVTNRNSAPRTLASWGLTMVAPGGTAVAGFPPRGTHPEMLLPTNPLVMWGYTDFSDPRWTFTSKYLVLRQDPRASTPVKAGLWNPRTWQAYLLGSDLFVKSTLAQAAPERYPDMGCSLETFTNADFLEMETLSPLVTLEPGQSVSHTEHWRLHRHVRIAQWTDDELDRVLLPLLSGELA